MYDQPVEQQHFILHFLVQALAVLLTSKLVSGFKVSGFIAACLAALVIGFANAIIWPVLIVLTLPINVLTLGLFTFVVNGAVLKLCAWFVPGFDIDGWISAIIGSVILSVVSIVLHYVLI